MIRASSILYPVRDWFEYLPAKAPAVRLYCFPYAGGRADVYRSWRQWFPEKVQIFLVHLPGHGKGMGEQCFTLILPLVNAIAGRIECEPKIPYALYGHSMGALIGFELARELFRRRATRLQHLLVSGRRAPQCPRDEPSACNLPHHEFLAELKRLDGTPKEVFDNLELIEMFIDILRADFELVETYEYRPADPLSCPITVYCGLDDKHVSIENCQGWQEQTSAKCDLRMFQGDHFFVRNPDPEFIAAFRSDVLSAVPDLR